MSSAIVALQAPLRPEPMLEAIRSFAPRSDERTDDPPRRAEPIRQAGVDRTTPAVTKPVTWVDPKDSLWLLSLKNYGLALATFGIYHFWGRAEMNRQMINAIHVDGKPLDYTGTGREAFASFVLGAIICAAIVSAFVYLFLLGPGGGPGNPTVEGIRQFRWQRLIISLPLLFLLGSITYRRRHHILRRSWLNGQRFRLTGFAWSYAWLHFWSAFTVPLTAGWAAPWRSSMLAARKVDEMRHDSGMTFHAQPQLGGLYRAYALVWLGGGLLYVATLVVLAKVIGPELMAAINGLTIAPLMSWHVLAGATKVLSVAIVPLVAILFMWRKAWLEHQISAIAFEGGRLRLDMPLQRYLALEFGGLALSIASLGCFKPVARARFMKFVVDHTSVEGVLKLSRQGH